MSIKAIILLIIRLDLLHLALIHYKVVPKIVKGIYITLLVSFLSFQVKGQVLISTSLELNLNPGGVIYDIEVDPFNNVYLVVGNFTSIQDQNKKNFAAINMDDFLVNNDPRYDILSNINGTNGTIRSVDVYSRNTTDGFGAIISTSRYIFLGGDFSYVNDGGGNQNRDGFATYRSYQDFTGISDFSLQPFEPSFDYTVPILQGFTQGVHDILIDGDSLFIVGNFEVYTDIPAFGYEYNILKIDLPSFTQIQYPIGGGITSYGDVLTSIHRQNGLTFVGGDGIPVLKIDPSGNFSSVSSIPSQFNAVYNIQAFQDSLIYVRMDTHSDDDAGDNSFLFNQNTGDIANTHPLMINQPSARLASVATYKNTVFGFDANNIPVGFVSYEDIGIPITNSNQNNWSAQTNNINYNTNPLKQNKVSWVLENTLFFSASGLTTAGGQPRTGLATFCLEPADITFFTQYDSTICQGDTVTFTFPAVDYAEKYEWSYSGTGVDLNPALGPVVTFFDNSSNSLDIEFLNNFTPGILTVTPYTTCNNNTLGNAKVYSNSISINISLNPQPNAYAGLDTIVNCYNNNVVLSGFSDTLGVTYSWNQINTPFTFDSLGQNLTVQDSNEYVLTVEATNGCLNFDTVSVALNITTPTFDLVPSGILGCTDTLYFLGHCNNATDTVSWWQKVGNPSVLSNPLACSSPGFYNFYTIDNENGCIDSLNPSLNVGQNMDLPNINVLGYSSIPGLGIALDTIDCITTSLNLTAISDTANTVLNWVDLDSTNPIGIIKNITAGGQYFIHVEDTIGGCINYQLVFIEEYTAVPIHNLDSSSALSCSNDSLLLNGWTPSLDTTLVWTGTTIPSNSNPVWIYNPGTYTLSITNNLNGCSALDSITIAQDNSIDVTTSGDTVVCDQKSVPVSAGYVGTITGITYLWDDGSTNATSSYTGGTDPYAIIEVFGDAGCYGKDTIFIDIPPTPVINFQGFQPCGTGSNGSIVASPVSGWAPFDYSIDNGVTYQSNSTLGGLDLGTYNVTVRDTLNCEYNFPVTISNTSTVATPEFLFSTYNYQTDTVIVIDVSSPLADSVDWSFSPEIVVYDENNGSPMIILPDTGSFTVTMDAYYGTCLNSVTKQIFVSELDSTDATTYNSNGIKSVDLYPNPTSGTFTVTVEFYKKQNATIAINDMNGIVYNQEEFIDTDLIVQDFTLSAALTNGTYVLRIVSEFDSAYITFILNR